MAPWRWLLIVGLAAGLGVGCGGDGEDEASDVTAKALAKSVKNAATVAQAELNERAPLQSEVIPKSATCSERSPGKWVCRIKQSYRNTDPVLDSGEMEFPDAIYDIEVRADDCWTGRLRVVPGGEAAPELDPLRGCAN